MILLTANMRTGAQDPDALNVTRMFGSSLGRLFAPSEALLFPFVRGRKRALAEGPEALAAYMEAQWPAYRAAYLDEMRASYARHRVTWDSVAMRERLVLLCACDGPQHCHRSVLASECFVPLGARIARRAGRPADASLLVHYHGELQAHRCHAPGCDRSCPPDQLMCRSCWARVRHDLQRAVLASRQGTYCECTSPSPSPAWVIASNAAKDHIEALNARDKARRESQSKLPV